MEIWIFSPALSAGERAPDHPGASQNLPGAKSTLPWGWASTCPRAGTPVPCWVDWAHWPQIRRQIPAPRPPIKGSISLLYRAPYYHRPRIPSTWSHPSHFKLGQGNAATNCFYSTFPNLAAAWWKSRGVAVSRLATLAAIYQRPGLIIIGLFDKNAAWRALIKRPGFAADAGGKGTRGDSCGFPTWLSSGTPFHKPDLAI